MQNLSWEDNQPQEKLNDQTLVEMAWRCLYQNQPPQHPQLLTLDAEDWTLLRNLLLQLLKEKSNQLVH